METRSKSKRRRDDEVAQEGLASIIQILVDNQLINHVELGALAQVSKQLQAVATHDTVWESLCTTESVCVRDLLQSGQSKMGARLVYKKWISGSIIRTPLTNLSCLPFPSCTINDLTIYFNISYGTNKLDFKVTGPSISILFEKWAVGINPGFFSNEILRFGQAKWLEGCFDDDEVIEIREEENTGFPLSDLDFSKLNVKVRMFRRTDDALISIFDSDSTNSRVIQRGCVQPLRTVGESLSNTSIFDLSQEQTPTIVSLYPAVPVVCQGLALKTSNHAMEVKSRLQDPIYFGVNLHLKVIEKSFRRDDHDGGAGKLRPVADGDVTSKKSDDGSAISKDFQFVLAKVELLTRKTIFHGTTVTIPSDQATFEEDAKKHGVSLLHYLSELQE